MDDRASVRRAVDGASGVYSAQDYWTVGAQREVAQGKTVADVAKEADVTQIVYSSVGGAERNSRITHWETKWQIEQHIRRLELPATILRPAGFMENYYIPAAEKSLLKGRLVEPLKPDVPYQTIASDDIGKFVALAFERPGHFIGLELEIAGSELTDPQAAEVFSRVLGRRVRYRRLPLPAARLIGKELYEMYRWFNQGGFEADIPALRRDYPEIHLRSLEEWLREQGWEGRREVAIKRDKMGRPIVAS
jgi:uncharacterized protein YbjT (DUF2867 family)